MSGGAQRVGEAALRIVQRSVGVRSGQEEERRVDVSRTIFSYDRIVCDRKRTACSCAVVTTCTSRVAHRSRALHVAV